MSRERAIADVKRFTQAEFSQELTFIKNGGTPSVVVRGLVSKHNNLVDPETGLPVNTRNIHISLPESILTDQEYPTRNGDGDIELNDDLVSWEDASGNNYTYVIREVRPSMTVDWIVCILEDYE